MQTRKGLWGRVWDRIVAPKVSEEELDAVFTQIKQDLPIPVFWLLGKTQSGKTSIIRALTANTRAEIGSGFRPCTRTASMYPFPSETDCLLRFLDTRGLGEVAYDPSEDIALFQNQAHLLIVVMKAMDHAQESVMKALQEIHQARPHWPVLVVQTSLHEGYAAPAFPHLLPYPYGSVPVPPTVPPNLVRSLLSQREMVEKTKIPVRFVAVDFTLPEDGFVPSDYGLEELWTAIEEILPLGLRGMLQVEERTRRTLRDVHFKTALPHIISYSVAAGAAAGLPVPLVDIPLILGIQAKMFHTIASIYHQEFDRQQMGEILSTLGIGLLGRMGGREIFKLIPIYGQAVTALYAAACTYGLGTTLCVYFSRARDGALPDQAEFRKIYEAHYQEGRDKLRSYLDGLRKKQG